MRTNSGYVYTSGHEPKSKIQCADGSRDTGTRYICTFLDGRCVQAKSVIRSGEKKKWKKYYKIPRKNGRATAEASVI